MKLRDLLEKQLALSVKDKNGKVVIAHHEMEYYYKKSGMEGSIMDVPKKMIADRIKSGKLKGKASDYKEDMGYG